MAVGGRNYENDFKGKYTVVFFHEAMHSMHCIRLNDLCCLGSQFCILRTMAYFRKAGVDDTILETASRGGKHKCAHFKMFYY